jgi:Major Facilitator Superfamily
MPSPTISFSEYLRLTRENRNFRKLWLAQIVSEIGDWFYTIAIFSLLLDLTGKAQSVAIGLVLWVLPQTFVGPIAGAVNDRISRRKVMITADLARVVIVGCMLLVRSASMAWLIYPLILLETVMAGFFEPARNSVIPNITPEEDVIVANTLASTTWSFTLAIGSLIGGIVAATLGREAVFVINALSFLVSAMFISRMQFDEPHITHQRLTVREVFDYSPMIEGFRYIGHDLKMLAMVALRGGTGILGAAWVLFPVFGQRVLPMPNLGRQDYALVGMSVLMTARGIGSLIGPLIAAQWAGINQPRLRRGVLIGFVIGGVGYVLLGASPTIWIAAAVVLLAHAGNSVVWVFSTTLLQLNSDDRFRGRIFAADFGLAMAVIALSAWASGKAIDGGVSPRVVASAVGASMIIPTVLWASAQRLWKPEAGASAE